MRKRIETGLPKSSVKAEWAVQSDDLLYTVHWAIKPDGTGETGDIRAQARLTFDNLRKAVEAAGGSMADVNQVLVYLTTPDAFAGMNEVWNEVFSEPYPSRATVLAQLLMP